MRWIILIILMSGCTTQTDVGQYTTHEDVIVLRKWETEPRHSLSGWRHVDVEGETILSCVVPNKMGEDFYAGIIPGRRYKMVIEDKTEEKQGRYTGRFIWEYSQLK